MPLRFALLMACLLSTTAAAQDARPTVIRPDSLAWKDYAPGIVTMSLVGQGRSSGVYAARVRFAPNTKLPPHYHPDDRYTLVLKGTLYVGFGEVFDESKLVAVPEGALYFVPAGVRHFLWSRGELVYQESGTNPTATTFVGSRGPS